MRSAKLIAWRYISAPPITKISASSAHTKIAFSSELTTITPGDEATGVAIDSNIVVTFSEAVARGTGNIVLKTTTGVTVATYDAATSSNLSISGSTLTLNPTADLTAGTAYKVEFAAGSLKDLAGNSYAGTTSYNFTTIPAGVVVIGTAGPDNLIGTAGADTLQGGNGNDVLNGMGGNDALDGGGGIDTTVFSGARVGYTVTRGSGDTLTVSGADGMDSLSSVERLKFSDVNVAMDVDGNAGLTAKILGAIFGAPAVLNKEYVGIGLTLLDEGMSYADLMQFALNAKLGTGFSDAAEINLLYQNLTGVLPSATDLDYWTGTLSSGQFTQSSLAQMAAGLSLNTININLIGLQQTGIEFI